MISSTQLEYIVALDKHRHFVQAAEECFVTQPTLSMQVKKLEEQLGILIFDRSKQPLEPTSLGKKIIQQARIAISENKKILELVGEYQDKMEGEINLGVIPSLAPYLLPLFIGSFTKKYPKIQVNIRELLSEEIMEELRNESLDIGLLVTPLHEKDIVENILFYEKILFYVNSSHSLAKMKNIKAENINSDDMWMMSEGHCFRSQVVNLCSMGKQISMKRGFRYESGSIETIKNFVEKEGGFTLVPELSIGHSSNAAVAIAIEGQPLREVSIVHSKNYYRVKIIGILCDEIKENVPIDMLNEERGEKVEWR